MNCVGGLSYEEIAQTLQCSIGTVKSRLWRARQEMQRLIYGTDVAIASDTSVDTEEKPARKARETEAAAYDVL